MLLQELSAFLPQWPGCPSSPGPHTPGLGKNSNGRKGRPSRHHPSLPNKGQNSEEEGQEVEDSMFSGIHPLLTPKLTQSLIQNLAFGSGFITKNFQVPKTSIKAT